MKILRRLFLSFVFVFAGFVAGLVITGRMRTASESRADPQPAGAAPQPQAPTSGNQRPAGAALAAGAIGPDFTRVAASAVKGVANISSLQVVRQTRWPFPQDDFVRYFFGDDIFAPRDRPSLSLGSGVMISADGYIVTNNHVIGENANARTEITITLPDKREIRGRIVGADPATDI